jgi:ribulose-5-phosphate 4-epimerase/fuculose-1-phosphate aldolase
MAAQVKDKSVLFLANHGVIVTGRSIARAFDDLYYLERAAQQQVLAMSTGRPLRRIRQDVVALTIEQYAEPESDYSDMHFTACKRLLDRSEPDYRT